MGGKIRVNHRCLDFNYRRNGTNCQWQNQRQRGIALICSVEIYLSHCRGGGGIVARRARCLIDDAPTVSGGGLLVGTVLGVALFKGVPVGPLIAAGLLSLVIGKS